MATRTACIHKRTPLRRLFSVATAGGLLLIALASGSPGTAASASTTKTAVHVVKPWLTSGRLRPGLHVAGRFRGSCWTESIAVAGEYRCTARNLIFDPCFLRPRSKKKVVGCLLAPWDKGVRTIRLTKKLPRVSQPRHLTSTRYPWGLQLASGVLCLLGQGTNPVVRHEEMVYSCKRGVAGAINRSREPWRTEYARSAHHGPVVQAPITQVWY